MCMRKVDTLIKIWIDLQKVEKALKLLNKKAANSVASYIPITQEPLHGGLVLNLNYRSCRSLFHGSTTSGTFVVLYML